MASPVAVGYRTFAVDRRGEINPNGQELRSGWYDPSTDEWASKRDAHAGDDYVVLLRKSDWEVAPHLDDGGLIRACPYRPLVPTKRWPELPGFGLLTDEEAKKAMRYKARSESDHA